MNIKHLRPGNRVRAKSPEKTEWVETAIFRAEYYNMYPKGRVHIERLVLTIEQLHKLGFTKLLDTWFKNTLDIVEDEKGDFYFTTRTDSDGNFKSGYQIQYVDQLQNIYCAFTNEELDYENNKQI